MPNTQIAKLASDQRTQAKLYYNNIVNVNGGHRKGAN